MGGFDGYMYFAVDVSLGRVMAARRSSRIFFTLILIGLVLPGCLVYYVLHFAYFVLRFSKSNRNSDKL